MMEAPSGLLIAPAFAARGHLDAGEVLSFIAPHGGCAVLTSLERTDGLEIVDAAAGRIFSAPMDASSNGLDRRFVEAGPFDLGSPHSFGIRRSSH
jgi:hypothetical protein